MKFRHQRRCYCRHNLLIAGRKQYSPAWLVAVRCPKFRLPHSLS
ncbi:hypothetical protein SLEP1_g41413 [Rubroshorea leprosula]|uniref:Uncharacterized protein n=1 Tax=Rubroshorea leprosula TaxID=152421 RepID=A0AAV5L7F1_9ROSI|nr:hypothetical protein SLEP1_g41413 [Rubroshorea leprosula]